MHHAHVIMTEGESVRLADALSGKGVVPFDRLAGQAARGEFSWPSVGRNHGRPRGLFVAVPGELWCPSLGNSDGRLWGVSRWPLTAVVMFTLGFPRFDGHPPSGAQPRKGCP